MDFDLQQLFENAGLNLPNENSLGEKIIPDDDPVKLQNFWNWFGNSKVVDEQGRPSVVFHGTQENIEVFNLEADGRYDAGYLGAGFYFIDKKETADWYKNNKIRYSNKAGIIINSYLLLKNPLVIQHEQSCLHDVLKALGIQYKGWIGSKITRKIASNIRNKIIKKGYDGVIYKSFNYEITYMVLYSNQIKSIDNKGTFSSTSNNIYETVAYHGTPTKFDEFSLKYISTGEGYQVHGWGIYLTLDKEVARGYKYRLGKKKERQLENWENKILNDIRDYGFDEVVKNIKYSLEKCKKINHTDGIKRYQTSLDFIDSLSVVDGMVLTVDIPNDEELLVEDDLLKNQSNKVKNIFINFVEELYGEQLDADKIDDYLDQIKDFIRKANIPDEQKEESDMLISYLFRSHLSDYKQNPDELFRTWNNEIIRQIDIIKLDFEDLKKANYFKENGNENYKNKIIAHNFIRNNLKNIIDMMTKNGELDLYGININYIMNNVKGKKFYKQLSDYFISKSNTKRNRGDCLASMWLLKQGVQGIKYHGGLDGDCVVIFNPKRVKIIGKE